MTRRPLLARRAWLHLPRRTVRLRLTALYGALFLASGIALIAITFGLLASHRVPASFNVVQAKNGDLTAVSSKIATKPQLLKLVECMRAQGVTVVYKESNGGQIRVTAGANPPRVTHATKICIASLGSAVGPIPLAYLANKQALDPPLKPGVPVPPVLRGVIAVLPTDVELKKLLLESAIALAIMTVISIGLGWVMAGRALRPLRVMTAMTRQISEENLHERLVLRGRPDEMTELGETINGLLGRLEKAFESQRRFVANASHELRTPLAMMRTSVDVAVAKPRPSEDVKTLAGKLEEGLEQAGSLLDGLLVLARAQRGAIGEPTRARLDELVDDAFRHEGPEVDRLGLTVQLATAPVAVLGNETLLARMAANLVDNAVRHNVPGGVLNISVANKDGFARLVIANSGAPTEPAEVAELGEPFRRLGPQRTNNGKSAGLGLSIARAIAEAHNGALELQPRAGGGLVVVVDLPVAPS